MIQFFEWPCLIIGDLGAIEQRTGSTIAGLRRAPSETRGAGPIDVAKSLIYISWRKQKIKVSVDREQETSEELPTRCGDVRAVICFEGL